MSSLLSDHPSTVTINGIEYSVNVNRDSDGEIEYYNVQDADGEYFWEADWQGAFTSEDVIRNYEQYNDVSDTDENIADEAVSPVFDEDSLENDDLRFYDDFDNRFPHLASYPTRFKNIAIRLWDSNFYESHSYQDIVISELSEYYDDCVEDGEFAVEEFYQTEED